jgi:hypothetical protein
MPKDNIQQLTTARYFWHSHIVCIGCVKQTSISAFVSLGDPHIGYVHIPGINTDERVKE